MQYELSSGVELLLVTFAYNGHRFDVNWGGWFGGSRVFYDGRCVSSRGPSLSIDVYTDFSVTEDGQPVRYDVILKGMRIPTDVEVRRNGVLIYCRSSGGLTGQPLAPLVVKPEPLREVIREVTVREVVLVLCPHCNHRNEASRRTCEKCGASF